MVPQIICINIKNNSLRSSKTDTCISITMSDDDGSVASSSGSVAESSMAGSSSLRGAEESADVSVAGSSLAGSSAGSSGISSSSSGSRVWLTSVPPCARTTPANREDWIKLRDECVGVIERQDCRMRIMLDDHMSKKRTGDRSRKPGTGKQGKNKYKKGEMADEDSSVLIKMSIFVRSNILPRWKFLPDGWEIFSESPNSFCQAVIKFCEKEIGAGENKFLYWLTVMAPAFNYKVCNGRSEFSQGMRKTCNGNYIHCLYFLCNHSYFSP